MDIESKSEMVAAILYGDSMCEISFLILGLNVSITDTIKSQITTNYQPDKMDVNRPQTLTK